MTIPTAHVQKRFPKSKVVPIFFVRAGHFCILGQVWRRAHNVKRSAAVCVDATLQVTVSRYSRRTKERQGIQGPGKVRAWIGEDWGKVYRPITGSPSLGLKRV